MRLRVERDFWQLWSRYIQATWAGQHLTVWLSIGGRKPLAHVPLWIRRVRHLPAIRVRLWPRMDHTSVQKDGA